MRFELGRARCATDIETGPDGYIYFFDTPDLGLLSAGIIARARRTVGGEHDSTVKFRPVDPGSVGRKWQKYPDFKIEAELSGEPGAGAPGGNQAMDLIRRAVEPSVKHAINAAGVILHTALGRAALPAVAQQAVSLGEHLA